MEINENILNSDKGIYNIRASQLINTFNDHGNEVTELISSKPPFWVRWGTLYFFFSLLIIGLVCWFIKYPDKIIAKGKLNSINAPKEVVVQSGGKLVKLFVKENQQVGKGDVLGYMESTANHSEVITLYQLLDSLYKQVSINGLSDLSAYLSVHFNNLGELQSAYQTFSQACITYDNYLQNGFYIRKQKMLDNDMAYLQQLHTSLQKQKTLMQQDLSLTDSTFQANEILKEQKVISPMEYRNEKSKKIAKEMALPQISSSIISNESQQNEKKKEIAELQNQVQQQKDIFIQAVNTIKSQVDEWERKYLLTAPIDGTVSFAAFLQENQQLRQGEIACYINPGNTNYYVEALIPQYNFGKIKTGQIVLLKFPAYPYQEFGSVKGTIEFINATPSDSGYLAKVSLPNGLLTNYKKQVRYNAGLTAEADIITENMNLLQRLFYNLRKNISQ